MLNPGALGTLARVRGAVRLRPSDSPFWHDLERDVSVTTGELIFTGPTGLAQLRFADGRLAEILPDSLVLLELPSPDLLDLDAQPVLRLKTGALRMELRARASTSLRLGEAGKEISLRPREEVSGSRWVELSTEPTARGYTVSAQFPLEVKTGEAVDSLAPELARLLSPRDGIALFSSEARVELRWETSQDRPAVVELLASDGVVRALPPTRERSRWIELQPGAHRWRVRIGDRATPWAAFQHQLLRAPRILAPAPGARIELGSQAQQEIAIRWDALADGLVPEVEIQDSGNKSWTLLQPASAQGALARLPQGEYRFRTRVTAPAGAISEWGAWSAFSLVPKAAEGPQESTAPPALSPLIADPVLNARFEPLPAGPGSQSLSFLLRWSAIPRARLYSIRLLSARNAVIAERRTRALKESFTLRSAEHLQLFAEISAEFADQPLRKARIAVRLALPPPHQIRPASGRGISRGAGLALAWTRTPLGKEYEFQLSRDEDFSRLLRSRTLNRNWTYFRPEPDEAPGTLYWRVRALAPGHQSAWSETRSLLLR